MNYVLLSHRSRLEAVGVEFGLAKGVAVLKCEGLLAEEAVAVREARGDDDGNGSSRVHTGLVLAVALG